ncbi:indolepyruvate oxidoreductase subunit beta [candidate division LCP-89 bacterium B3_LCP]|uniref:Indolepyruvate oxidoreductase subunit beta n=1 Tax=candidate division LCP-89 bacterium B3_LCP TaxID=2012998 RepID=A0A532UZ85_UNCL8|nr:MAG: indolepyruvate oxidoreductase subunit beta [candidate division LCP-89 bacterium B3_LCP]
MSKSKATNQTMNVLIVGVGGQGVLLASQILSDVNLQVGNDVKKSEVHGMAQRGGVVSSHIRFGKKVYSPLIPNRQADVILAFERAEALRWVHELKPGGYMVVNDQIIMPPIAVDPKYVYPDGAIDELKRKVENLNVIDAAGISEELGNPRLANTVLLGALSNALDIDESLWKEVISRRVPKATIDLNLKAFDRGRGR